jgi:hypothetical protein
MIGENGKKYSQNNTLDFGFSLFLTNLGMIDSATMLTENVPLNLN